MTNNQINYQRLREDTRHNKVTEGETSRHNVETENENFRHNVQTEGEAQRHNVVAEQETSRHNVVQEAIGWSNAGAANAQASASLSQAATSAAHQEYLNTTDAKLRGQQNLINAANAFIGFQNAGSQRMNAETNRQQLEIEASKAGSQWFSGASKYIEPIVKYGLPLLLKGA